MASLIVRNIDAAVKQNLRERAAAKGHSMEEEVRTILTNAARSSDTSSGETGADLFARIRERFRGLGDLETALRPELPGREPPIFE